MYWDLEHWEGLLAERNANSLCAWPLCPQPPITACRGRFKIAGGQLHDARLLGRYCGPACCRLGEGVRGKLSCRPAFPPPHLRIAHVPRSLKEVKSLVRADVPDDLEERFSRLQIL